MLTHLWNNIKNTGRQIAHSNHHLYAIYRAAILLHNEIESQTYGYKRLYLLYKEIYTVRDQPVILVYQMGKVGSMSVAHSLRVSGVPLVYHIHRLNLHSIARLQQQMRERQNEVLQQRVAGIEVSKALYHHVVQKHRPIKIITLVREPIGRNISAFFHGLRNLHQVSMADFTNEQLTSIFIKEYMHHIPLVWFDEELYPVFGINIYDHPFPKDQGYMTIQHDHVDLLVMRIDLDDRVKEKVISAFMGLEHFHMTRINTAEDGKGAEKYHDFVKHATLPESYVETMCRSTYMRHFYSEEHIAKIRAKWLK